MSKSKRRNKPAPERFDYDVALAAMADGDTEKVLRQLDLARRNLRDQSKALQQAIRTAKFAKPGSCDESTH